MTNVIITEEQVKDLCECFGVDFSTIEDYEIGEMIDKAIDDFVSKNSAV